MSYEPREIHKDNVVALLYYFLLSLSLPYIVIKTAENS